ncbi:MAG: class I SAM-dependent RNA methyltransferase [Bacteriovoracia bacterium]
MRQKRTIPFKITGIDSLGQGVSKLTEKVTFIPKTLPEEQGEAEVMSEKKGVVFARLKKLSTPSARRIKPSCIHFDVCHSCHFLHVSYEEELNFKKESFEKLFRKLPLPAVEIIGAPARSGYRNRIQLHYSLRTKLLGMRDPQTFEITPVPQCLIALPEIVSELERLYKNHNWLKEVPPSVPMDGHLEIYWLNKELKVSWNRPYAEGGFTQVYQEMNEKLKDILKNEWGFEDQAEVLDLFAGNGNMTQNLPFSRRLCIDVYQNETGPEFLNQNLYDNKARFNVKKELDKRKMVPLYLLLDPPRSGLKDLEQWVETFSPKNIAYVSCDPHTLARDLASLSDYVIKRAFLIDFFPSTFHFESLIFLERKS